MRGGTNYSAPTSIIDSGAAVRSHFIGHAVIIAAKRGHGRRMPASLDKPLGVAGEVTVLINKPLGALGCAVPVSALTRYARNLAGDSP